MSENQTKKGRCSSWLTEAASYGAEPVELVPNWFIRKISLSKMSPPVLCSPILSPFILIAFEPPGFLPLQHRNPLHQHGNHTHTFILFPEEYGPIHRDVHIVTRSGRVAQPPPVDRPFAGIDAREDVQREDDEILCQLRTTQAHISIWSLLGSFSTHRDALIRAFSHIRVDTTTTTSEGLIHFLTADRATCILFSDDNLPPEGSDHVRPSFIDVACSGCRVPSVLLDNGFALNVCPLVTAIALGFSPSDFGPSIQTVRAYDGTQRTVMGTLTAHVMIGPVRYSVLFQVLRIRSSFNLLLGRPWIHEAGAIPSYLHQKVKFMHEERIITIQYDRDVVTSFEPVLQISHNENDLHLIGFTFDEVQVVSLEDDSRDMVTTSRGRVSLLSQLIMTYHMDWVTLLLRRMHDTWRDCTGIGGSEHAPYIEGVDRVPKAVEIQGIQQALRQMCLSFKTTEPPEAMIVAFPSPDRASVFFMCFLEEILDYDLPMDLGDGSDGVIMTDTYMDEMDMISTGRSVRLCGPPLYFDTMFRFVTRFDDISNGNNDMSIFEYLPMSQHFPLIAPLAPTTHVCDIDDVGDTDDPLSGQSECDSDSDMEDRKVAPISGSTELIDFGVPDQPRELRIGSSLSPDERMVEYLEWFANVFHVPKKDDKILMALEDMEKTSFINEWGTYCYWVMPFGLKNVGATYQRAATTLFHDMMHKDVEAEIESQEVYLWGDFWELLGHIVGERGIEVDLKKIRAILDMPAPRTEREIRGFLGRLQYISRFIARLIDICEPIFRILRKNQPTVWNDDCHCTFEKIKECLLSSPVLVPPTPRRPLLLTCPFKTWLGMHCLCLALVWATRRLRHYVTEYSILLVSRLDPLRYLFDRPVLTGRLRRWLVLLTEFDIQMVVVFDGAANQSGSGIGILLISPQGDHIPRSVRLAFYDHHRLTNNIVEYEAYITGLETALDLGVRQSEIHGIPICYSADLRFEELRYIHLPRAENQFVDALATLASVIEIPAGVTVRPLLIETKSTPTYCCLIGDIEDQDELPWYHDIYQFLLCGAYLESASTKDRRALRLLSVCSEVPECQMHGDLIHMPPSELHALTSPWPFQCEWVEAASYARLIAAKEYGVHHHRSSAYRSQTNGAVEAANKNIKRISRKMVETSRDWLEKLPFALWAYHTSFRTSIGATPYSLVYGMEAVLPVEIEIGSLRVALEQQISETEWAQSRYDQLSLLDERRLRAADHVQAY
ncbi:Transposon Ty3-I Gag-Pol polyprotein [Vitis vinifera]|uniref:RNA-directed DNA polymerase n=1 Tax=Vitis vinifera TaxID=29760 RepID=A0A438CIZ6_VITVI|nr:Transposon Ty3-I Gag-Pol polyprotein [Vitis vinifera]